jgi:hypothetical protein
MNSHAQNALKVIIGFIPAFLTFALTKDWWLLAYFGAFIWFGITGLRNIVQSVLGGGGFKRSASCSSTVFWALTFSAPCLFIYPGMKDTWKKSNV